MIEKIQKYSIYEQIEGFYYCIFLEEVLYYNYKFNDLMAYL